MSFVLLMRLAGPVQSWGLVSRFADIRDSRSRPTKSGVVGMAAAALGMDRVDPLGEFGSVRFGVRADRPGSLVRDYSASGSGSYPLRPRDLIQDSTRADRVAKKYDSASGDHFGYFSSGVLNDWYGAPKEISPDESTGNLVAGNAERDAILATKWNIVDGSFVAAFECADRDFLSRIGDALESPARMVWLGRKACPPSGTISGGVHEGSLAEVLERTELLPNASECRPWVWLESAPYEDGASRVNDEPVSFHPETRSYAPRWEQRFRVNPGSDIKWEVIP